MSLKVALTFEANIPQHPVNCVQSRCAMECFHKNLLCSSLFDKI